MEFLRLEMKNERLLTPLMFSGLLLSGFLTGCVPATVEEPEAVVEEAVEAAPKQPVQKKVLFNQRTEGGKNEINVIEEMEGNKRSLRIVVQRGDLNSNLVHPIDSPNFVITLPLQDSTSKQFTRQTALFEENLKTDIDRLLSRYLAPERFNVSVGIQWDEKLLQEVQLSSVPLDSGDADSDLEKVVEPGLPATEGGEGRDTAMTGNPELRNALSNLRINVLLDNTLPNTQEQFILQLIPAQEYFNKDRGDSIAVERTSFPNPFSNSVAPYEEQIITRKLKELIEKYVSANSYVLNVEFALNGDAPAAGNADPASPNLRMTINILLDDTILPEVDTFLKEAIPLAVHYDPERGDRFNIVRNRFPEQSTELFTQEQLSALREYRDNILESFQTGDYVSGLEWAGKGLKVAVKREDKIFLLKMKGSLHFLLAEKDRALETWKHVQRLDPKDEEVTRMLSNME